MQSVINHKVIMLRVGMLKAIFYCYAERLYAECHFTACQYAEYCLCLHAEYRYAECCYDTGCQYA